MLPLYSETLARLHIEDLLREHQAGQAARELRAAEVADRRWHRSRFVESACHRLGRMLILAGQWLSEDAQPSGYRTFGPARR
jgi:hypothetical protein